jgi:hypothetical protein
MGLDLLVMPLSRYFAGQFQGPVEALATRIGNPKPSEPETLAHRRVLRLREDIERRLGKTLFWSEEGDVALSVQHHYGALHALRAFAAYQEYPAAEPFRVDGAPEDHPSLAKIYYQNAPTRFRHLIDQSDASGFYLPCDFDEPVPWVEVVEGPSDKPALWEHLFARGAMFLIALMVGGLKELREERREEKKRERWIKKLVRESPYPPRPAEALPRVPRGQSLRDWGRVGSSVRLLRELEELLQRRPDLKETPSTDNDPLGSVRYGWQRLHQAAQVSVERGLPLIFDG